MSSTAPTILVVGASGFIGGEFTKRLEGNGFGCRKIVRQARNLDEFQVDFDWPLDDPRWIAVFEGIEVVIHLIGNSNESDPNLFNINVGYTERVARLAGLFRINRLIYVSSIKAVKTTNSHVKSSVEGISQALSCYGRSKLMAERVLKNICIKSGVEYVIVRPPPVYGPGGKGGINKLIWLATHRFPIPYLDSNSVSSILAVTNLCDFLELCMHNPRAANKTFSVRDNRLYTFRELICDIEISSGKKPFLVKLPSMFFRLLKLIPPLRRSLEKYERQLVIDNTLVRSELDWVPKVDMKFELERMMGGGKLR